MDIEYLLDIFNEISSITGKNGKLQALRSFKDDVVFIEALRQTYDPFIKFNKTLPEGPYIKSGPKTLTLDHLMQLQRIRFDIQGLYENLTYRSSDLLSRIVNKDARMGVGPKSILKVFPGLFKAMPYMRCNLKIIENLPFHKGLIIQPKLDGLYGELCTYDMTMTSRQGRPLLNFRIIDNLLAGIAHHPDTNLLRGELRVFKNGVALPRAIGNGIIRRVTFGGRLPDGCSISYIVWDALTGNGDKTPYSRRLGRVPHSLVIDTQTVWTFADAKRSHEENEANGYEGSVVKDPDGILVDGDSPDQTKWKTPKEVVLRAIALLAGKGRLKDTFGAILCVSDDGELTVNISGFTDADRRDILKCWSKHRDTAISVKFKDISTDSKGNYSLYEPRFAGWRDDKEPETLEEILKRYPTHS